MAYLDAARLHADGTIADRKVAGSNAVLGGIAAADAICGHVLGERHAGDDHSAARQLLARACAPDTSAAAHLKRLIDEKTNFQYSTSRVTERQTRALLTSLERLVATMESHLAR